MLSLINRGKYVKTVEDEFQHLIGRLRALLSQILDVNGEVIIADPNLAVVPVGAVQDYAGTTAPSGWLICDGSQVSRVTYKSLFDVIGVAFGVGDGSTTFNIPDARQKFILGKAASGTGATLGSSGGAIDHTHTMGAHTHSIGSGGSHSHTVNSHAHSGPSHSHSFSGTTDDGSGSAGGATSGADIFPSLSNHTHAYSGTTGAEGTGNTGSSSPGTDSQGSHDHGGSTGSASAGTSGTANPPYLSLNKIVFTGVAA
jgi:microcystin-dependent protein